MNPSPSLCVIGAGSLARALVAGWAARGEMFREIVTVSRRDERAAELAGSVTRALSLQSDPDAVQHAAAEADIVLIAVKPWMVRDLLPRIADTITSTGAIVVSVAAGVRIETLRAGLGASPTIVRVLPNTPSQVNQGVAGIVGDGDPALIDRVRTLFRHLGDVVDVGEDELDSMTVLTGSAPAFIYLFTEELAAAMTAQGFAARDADRMARSVLIGAARLLEVSGEDLRTLRRRVTSPGGVTHSAVEVFEARGLGQLVIDASAAGLDRARQLATEPGPAG